MVCVIPARIELAVQQLAPKELTFHLRSNMDKTGIQRATATVKCTVPLIAYVHCITLTAA